jgi:hypothetical protein
MSKYLYRIHYLSVVIDANPFWPEMVSTTSEVNLMFNSIKMAMATNLYQ